MNVTRWEPTGDHPRVCGEHRASPRSRGRRAGSSPRMRGTPRDARRRYRGTGIIPAYAGNTEAGQLVQQCFMDHPRVCGEHWEKLSGKQWRIGSSPRMRGTRPAHRPRPLPGGIIPAYAGNTGAPTTPTPHRGDHPRVCGEHTKRLA